MNWQERVDQLRRDEERLRSDRHAFVVEMARAVWPFYDGLGSTATAKVLGIETGHAALINRLLDGKQASTGFMAELAVGLDREEGAE